VLRQVVSRCEQSGGFRGLCTIRVNERELINVFFCETREDGERGRDPVRTVLIDLLAGAFDGVPEFAGAKCCSSMECSSAPRHGTLMRHRLRHALAGVIRLVFTRRAKSDATVTASLRLRAVAVGTIQA
jgi:hypothetical protein